MSNEQLKNHESRIMNQESTFVPFLQHVADDLFEQYGNDLSNVTIIAPNKRANLFFNQYLFKHVTDKPIWTPRFTTIGDVFDMLCPLKVADPIQQICKLYQAYKTVSQTEETLDKFYSWAELMKNDFEDIDNNLADAEKLFTNISDLEELKDFSFLSENQKNAIYQYFQDLNIGRNSELKERFLGVWKYMFDTYTEYRRLLSESGLCYSGMQKRHVVEGIKNGDINIDEKLNNGVYVVIGFNVLNETEKLLFKSIKAARTTLFYWDYDEKYLTSEAGRFISENIKLFGNRFSNHPEYYRHLGKQNSVRFIKSPTENAQTRFVGQWLDEKITSHPLQESVVVLCNENVLQPVLHSIPSAVNGRKIEMNVTMGYPLQETPIYSYVLALMNLQLKGAKENGRWRYAQASVVLKHPYTKRLIGEANATKILAYLKRNNIMFPSTEQLTHVYSTKRIDGKEQIVETTEITKLNDIFTGVDGHLALTQYLIDNVKKIGQEYKEELIAAKKQEKEAKKNNSAVEPTTNFELQLYVESIFSTYSILNRVHTLQEREPIFNVGNSTLTRLLTQMLQQKSIPFHGEPAIGLQVMGLLETRNLDFRNVIMLSVNEGQLPKQDRMASLIPYALREAYGMTTIEKQVSLYAFYFYNLLQRAENVTLMYNSTADGLTSGEMSRFMMQLQVESNKIFNRQNPIELLSLAAPNESQVNTEISIEKTDEVKKKLIEYPYISPSAINNYIDCPLKFYLSKVAGFYEEDEVTEGVDNPMFGSIFHKAMELIYKPSLNKQLQAADIKSWIEKKDLIENIVDKAFAIEFFKMPEDLPSYHPKYNGEQLLNKYVIIKYVRNQLMFDMQSCPMTILGIEEKIETIITLNDDETNIKIGGIIDRYERIPNGMGGNIIRITDYKTNVKAQTTKSLEDIFDGESSNRAYNYLQALYYCEVYSRVHNPKEAIMPALMYIKTAFETRECRLLINKEPITDYVKQYQSQYRELLIGKLSEIYLEDEPFVQREHYCESCEFFNYCKK